MDAKSEDALDAKNKEEAAQPKEDSVTTQTTDAATGLQTIQDPVTEAEIVPEEPAEASPAEKKVAYEE